MDQPIDPNAYVLAEKNISIAFEGLLLLWEYRGPALLFMPLRFGGSMGMER